MSEVITMTENELLRNELEKVTEERDLALNMLASWCVDIDVNGSGWDYWDRNYKEAAYRDGPLRKLLDAAIKEERKARLDYEV